MVGQGPRCLCKTGQGSGSHSAQTWSAYSESCPLSAESLYSIPSLFPSPPADLQGSLPSHATDLFSGGVLIMKHVGEKAAKAGNPSPPGPASPVVVLQASAISWQEDFKQKISHAFTHSLEYGGTRSRTPKQNLAHCFGSSAQRNTCTDVHRSVQMPARCCCPLRAGNGCQYEASNFVR